MNDFFAQLKQWRVYRLAVSYAAAAWLILQLTIAVREPLGLPTWTLTAVIGVLMVGFSVALWVGWMQDHRTVTADGRTVPRSRRHHFAVALISLLPSALVAAVFLLVHRPAAGNGSTPRELPGGEVAENSVAVLPFDSLSADTDNAYFAEGIQDEILRDLSKVAGLKVISRTSVMAYRTGPARNLREIGRALGVAHLLEGSVQRALGKVRVTAQLIDARTDLHLWAEHYDGDLADIFAIQSQMAEQIVGNLKVRLSPDEKKAIDAPPTADPLAYDLFLQAKELVNDFQAQADYRDTLLKALRLLDEALAKDRDFALADCLAATAHDQLYWLEFDHTPLRLAQETAAVADALRVNPDLGEAHLARAMLLYHGSLDYEGALAELAIARKALPNSAQVLAITGYINRRQGRWPEAVARQEQAVALDPRNGNFLNGLMVVYDILRNYRSEQRVGEMAIRKVPRQAAFFQSLLAQVDLEMGQVESCRKRLAALPADYDPNGGTMLTRATLALYEHRYVEAAQIVATSKIENYSDFTAALVPRAWLEGQIARAAGDRDRATAVMTSARATVEQDARGQPDDAATLSLLGRIDAALGRKEDALREGRRSVELLPVSRDAVGGVALESALAMIYAWTGESDLALELLGPLSTRPGGPHYGELRFDPAWDALRGNARFEQLVAAMEPR